MAGQVGRLEERDRVCHRQFTAASLDWVDRTRSTAITTSALLGKRPIPVRNKSNGEVTRRVMIEG